MKKIAYLLLICLVSIACQQQKAKQSCETYEELADPAVPDSTWNTLESRLYASWGSVDVRYAKSSVPAILDQGAWKGSGWRGERLSAQLVLWSNQETPDISCTFSEFVADKNALPAGIAAARFVRYVITDVYGGGCGYRKPEDFSASLVADGLDNVPCFDIKARSVCPVWLTFNIPSDAKPGIYKSRLTVTSSGKEQYSFDVQLEVLNRTLPSPDQWAFHLDLWQHPAAVARWHKVPVWSEEHYACMRPLMKMLADAGQKVITATLNKDPWSQCQDTYADMILWTKKTDGSWSYDYSEFDRWVTFMMEVGVTKMINCYSMIPWNNELHYKDEKTGDTVAVEAKPGTPVFRQMWEPFLKDFVVHLKEKGWLDITNIAMDERAPEVMKETIGLIQKVAPQLGISLADNHKSYKEYPFIKDLCVSFGATVDSADLKYRKEKGLITTYYVCCSHPFPNMFTFSAPIESVYAAWYASAAGLDGFLRWAYNSWVEDPLRDSRFRKWPAGDTYIVYPEARSSIRFERLREGIQDVEKIRLLREEWTRENNTASLAKLEQLEKTLAKFNVPEKPEGSMEDMVNTAKRSLEDLSR